MRNLRLVTVLCGVLLMSSLVFAQEERTETTVEQEYLSTVEDIIITELSSAQDYDSKVIALEYLDKAVTSGRTSPDMDAALRSLAGEGVLKESRTNGRLANNYPDVRARACYLLGEVGNEQAKTTLTEIVLSDNEPMVTIAAIKALGKVTTDNCDDVVSTIAWSEKKYARINPTSSLAFEVLDAYEKLAPNIKDNKEMIRSISEIAVNQYYTRTVREKAIALLTSLKGL